MSSKCWYVPSVVVALLLGVATTSMAQVYVAPPTVSYYTPAIPVVPAAPVVGYYAPAPVSYYAPAPVVSYYAPVPAVSYYAPAPVYYTPATVNRGLFGRTIIRTPYYKLKY